MIEFENVNITTNVKFITRMPKARLIGNMNQNGVFYSADEKYNSK